MCQRQARSCSGANCSLVNWGLVSGGLPLHPDAGIISRSVVVAAAAVAGLQIMILSRSLFFSVQVWRLSVVIRPVCWMQQIYHEIKGFCVSIKQKLCGDGQSSLIVEYASSSHPLPLIMSNPPMVTCSYWHSLIFFHFKEFLPCPD